jgi:hypothetical protein
MALECFWRAEARRAKAGRARHFISALYEHIDPSKPDCADDG